MSRALVLGGGGVAGAAWETGILLGLSDAGIDVASAERVIGTSAGARVGAELANGVALADSFHRLVGPVPGYEIDVELDAEKLMAGFGRALSEASPGIELNQAIGRYATGAETVSESTRRGIIAGRLTVRGWPDRDLRVVAIDVQTGLVRVFTPADDVDLVDAVAASCAVPGVWPVVSIGSARFMDGGMRSTSNTDLATGCDVVLVVAPMPELPMIAPEVKHRIADLAKTARLVRIGPDEASTAAIGTNPLDPASARPSAEAGRVQARAHVEEVAEIWNSDG
jgi:NTE family protein